MVICIWSCADVLVCKETGKFAGDVASEYLIWNSFSWFSSTAEALHNLHVCYCCSECGPPSLYKCMTESTFIEDTHQGPVRAPPIYLFHIWYIVHLLRKLILLCCVADLRLNAVSASRKISFGSQTRLLPVERRKKIPWSFVWRRWPFAVFVRISLATLPRLCRFIAVTQGKRLHSRFSLMSSVLRLQ